MAWGRTPTVPGVPGGHGDLIAVLAGDTAPARELGVGGGTLLGVLLSVCICVHLWLEKIF